MEEIAVDPSWAELPYDANRKLTGDEYFDNHVAVIMRWKAMISRSPRSRSTTC